ncbi:transforming growth factor beta activator LRRC32-like isoform X1 [Gopherus flavomarginatus]|uniref:transforming growth factor beta activator LRRC32-like isoform X1 n=2 Tax=Gopherus flavomarginatus TaxID=286002 RepID=UPI0021CC240B|nr:transforming growth factor beta activator LRRC32-like isoform X1 [Gopherus flavomarginatus]
MFLSEHWLDERGYLLLWLLPSVLKAQPSAEVSPKPLPCQQSSVQVSCQGLGLRTFPEKLGHGVKQLDLSDNFIQNLTESCTSKLGQLEHLNMHFNQLATVSEMALTPLTHLHSLLLAANHLDRNYFTNGRAFGSLKNLKVLDLSANNLDSDMAAWYFSSLTSLKKLDLSWNKMTRLPESIFQGTLKLREINLNNNYITEIEEGAFAALLHLKVVNLAMNSLHCISGFSLTQLQVLNLSYNALEFFVTDERKEHYQLQVLDLSHNKLIYFPELPKVHRLTHLNLSDNAMVSLAPSSTSTAEFRLRYDEMARPNISLNIYNAAARLSKITDLDLSSNLLYLFPVTFLHNLSSLQNLNMAKNCLYNIAVESPPGDMESKEPGAMHDNAFLSVRSLDLQGNFIHSLPQWFFGILPKLETLDLGSNSLRPCESQNANKRETPIGHNSAQRGNCTSFCDLPQLKYLSLRRNNIVRLYPYMFNQTSLVSLDLSENEDLFMPKGALEGLEFSLQKLSLRGNQMDNKKTEFPCLKMLKKLDMSDNKLSLLPPDLVCSPLENLDIRNNNLQALNKPATVRLSNSLNHLNVAGNPFSCCALNWLEILQAAHVNVLDLNETLCFYQDKNRNFSAKIANKTTWLCPHQIGSHYLMVLLVVITLCFLFLSCGICCHLKKSQKLSKYLGFRSNRVDPIPYHPNKEKRTEQIAIDRVTEV